MEFPYEIKGHQRMERDNQEKEGYGKVESPDKLQEEIIKGGKGRSFR